LDGGRTAPPREKDAAVEFENVYKLRQNKRAEKGRESFLDKGSSMKVLDL
jgi:hypothetical protein